MFLDRLNGLVAVARKLHQRIKSADPIRPRGRPRAGT